MKIIYDTTGLIPEQEGIKIYDLSHIWNRIDLTSNSGVEETVRIIDEHIRTIYIAENKYVPHYVLHKSDGIAFTGLNDLIIEAFKKAMRFGMYFTIISVEYRTETWTEYTEMAFGTNSTPRSKRIFKSYKTIKPDEL